MKNILSKTWNFETRSVTRKIKSLCFNMDTLQVLILETSSNFLMKGGGTIQED